MEKTKENLVSFFTHYSKAYSNLVPCIEEFLHQDLPEEVNDYLAGSAPGPTGKHMQPPSPGRCPSEPVLPDRRLSRERELQTCKAFLLGLKELTAIRTRHAHNVVLSGET